MEWLSDEEKTKGILPYLIDLPPVEHTNDEEMKMAVKELIPVTGITKDKKETRSKIKKNK